jgi:outer membrane protein assembly factor BamA
MRGLFLLLAFALPWTSVAQAPVDTSATGVVERAIARAISEGRWAARADSSHRGWRAGPLYRLRAVTVRDERGASPEGFAFAEFEGRPADRPTLEALQAAARRHYLDHGFPFAEITTRARAGDSLPVVDVELSVRRGNGYKRGAPVVFGGRTRPETARRLALWEEDEDFSETRLRKGAERLRRTGYYESAEWAGLYRDSLRNVLYPVLRLEDRRANTWGGLLGYDSRAGDGGLTGFVDVHLLNLFGTARDLDFNFDRRAGAENDARLVYTEPWLLNSPVGARLELGFLQQDTLYWEWNQALVFFRDLGFTSRLEAEFGAQGNRDIQAGFETRALRSGLRLLYDARDRAPFTRRGVRGSAGVSGLRREIGDSAYFVVQSQVSGETWRPLSSRLGLKIGASAGSNFPLTRSNPGELFYVGGARSLRGYREREFQTNAYALAEGEVHYWVGRRGSLFGFVAPGAVNRMDAPSSRGRYDPRGVLGYGAGLELAQGEWTLLLTYALNPERSPGEGLLHVAVENRF